MEGLAAMMTKLLSSMGDMETRITSMESRLQPPPTSNPTASMPYGMPGYGSTTLASSSSTAAATLSTAPSVTWIRLGSGVSVSDMYRIRIRLGYASDMFSAVSQKYGYILA